MGLAGALSVIEIEVMLCSEMYWLRVQCSANAAGSTRTKQRVRSSTSSTISLPSSSYSWVMWSSVFSPSSAGRITAGAALSSSSPRLRRLNSRPCVAFQLTIAAYVGRSKCARRRPIHRLSHLKNLVRWRPRTRRKMTDTGTMCERATRMSFGTWPV